MMLTRSDDYLNATVPANAIFHIPVPAHHPEWAVPYSPESRGLLLARYALPNQFIWLDLDSAEINVELLLLSVNSSFALPKDNWHGAKILGNVAEYPLIYRNPIGEVWPFQWIVGKWRLGTACEV